MMSELGLVFDTDAAQVDVQGKAQMADPLDQTDPKEDPETDEGTGDESAAKDKQD
jgi:hypothetical protein